MASGTTTHKKKPRPGVIRIDSDDHIAGALAPQTPLDVQASSKPPARTKKGRATHYSTESKGFLKDIISLRWVVVPTTSLKLLAIVVLLWATWEVLTPGLTNPFAPLLFVSHRVPTFSPEDPRYQKGYLDLVFVSFYIVVWSFVRQAITLWGFKPLARWYGIRKEGKLDRFGEQGYAVVYFAFTGLWGLRIMSQGPTWYYQTEHFWIDYPHWDMKPEQKSYYLMQAAYWCQQLLVLSHCGWSGVSNVSVFSSCKFVTNGHVWFSWSYLINLTRIGTAVYISMDIPDAFLGFSKLLNYLQFERGKVVSFAIFLPIWTYYRHFLNIIMLWSVWTQFDLIPESAKRWAPADGVWMVWWMKWQIFVPLFLLQLLNLWWYYHFILKIAVNAIVDFRNATDTRSDDEDDDEQPQPQDMHMEEDDRS
ncbi:TLC domain-containing protein [Irpex lacteus]|nr:TLC domain-containing protein [Irpex lacteus]